MASTNRGVVIDTMAMSAIVNSSWNSDRAAQCRAVIAGRNVVLSFATVTELRYGATKADWGDLRRRTLENRIAEVTVIAPDDDMMTACARFRGDCERSGHALGQKLHEADRWIAATALYLELDLISNDKVFENAPGLSLQTTRP